MGRAWVPRLKKFKTRPSAGKVMATVFWDAKGVIMLDFLPKRSTITVVYYANLLDQLRTPIGEKRRGELPKGVLLQQDNARVHTCKVAMDAVERNGYISRKHAYIILTPMKPHFYIVKLRFTGVYIIFLISAQYIDCGYSLEPPRQGGFNEYPQSMF